MPYIMTWAPLEGPGAIPGRPWAVPGGFVGGPEASLEIAVPAPDSSGMYTKGIIGVSVVCLGEPEGALHHPAGGCSGV